MLTPSAMSPGAKPSEMNVLNPVKPLLFSLNEADIPVSVVGEIVLNYYNVPRVVHVRFRHHLTLKILSCSYH